MNSMTIDFLASALFAIASVTSLIVEAIKKIFDYDGVKYSSNVLAAVISMFVTLCSSVVYLVLNKIEFTAIIFFEILALTFLSFLVSTVGYDKVLKTMMQIIKSKNVENEDHNDDTSE